MNNFFRWTSADPRKQRKVGYKRTPLGEWFKVEVNGEERREVRIRESQVPQAVLSEWDSVLVLR